MFCPKCGRKYADEANFCPGCGAPNDRPVKLPPVRQKEQQPVQSRNPEPAPKPAREEVRHQPQAARAEPPPLVSHQEEEEAVLPPPASGITINFRANQHGRMERAPDRPHSTQAGAQAAAGADGTSPAHPESTAGAGPTAAAMFAAAAEDCVLPPQTSMWAFRAQTGALADKIVAGFSSHAAGTPNPLIEGAGRLVRGALMHKDVYRAAASRGSLMTEAVWAALALIVISTVGLRIGNLFGYSSSFTLKMIVIRAIAWVGAVFAVHWVAKSQQKVDLPPAAWFRAMVYAQAGLVLMLVPAVGVLSTLWVAACTVAALQDVSGKDTTAGIILLVTAGVATSIVASVVASLWV